MFDPNKYDKSNSGSSSEKETFIDKRAKIITYLLDMRSLIIKECEFLEQGIAEDPNSPKASAFKEKLDGWSRLINGSDILNKMYFSQPKK